MTSFEVTWQQGLKEWLSLFNTKEERIELAYRIRSYCNATIACETGVRSEPSPEPHAPDLPTE